MVGQKPTSVLEGRPALSDCGHDGGEVVVEQHKIGGLPRHVAAGEAHGHADVRLAQGGPVVDTVAGHGHDVPPGTKCLGDAQLLLRADACDDHAVPIDECAEQLIIVGKVGPRQHGCVAGSQVNLLGDRPSGTRVVTGDHRNTDSRRTARIDGPASLRAGWVLESQQREQLEAVLGFIGSGRHPLRPWTRCDGQHPQATLGHRRQGRRGRWIEGVAAFEDGVGGPLDQDLGVRDDRGPPTVRIEGKLVRDRCLGHARIEAKAAGERIDGGLHRIAVSDPDPAVLDCPTGGTGERCDRRVGGHAAGGGTVGLNRGSGFVAAAVDADEAFAGPDLSNAHPVLGDRAGLVGADEGGRPQRLDRLQPSDQRMLIGHLLGADGQRQRDGRQQPFGHQRHGDPDRKDEPIGGGGIQERCQPEKRRPDANGNRSNGSNEPVQFPRERRIRAIGALGQYSDLGQTGAGTRGADHCEALTLDQERTGVQRVAHSHRVRNALARQRRHVHRKPVALDTLKIRTDPVTLGEHHQVVRHHLGGEDRSRDAVTDHRDALRQQVPETLGGSIGPMLLDECEDAVDHDDHEDRPAQLRQSAQDRQHARSPQHEGEEVNELGNELAPRRNPLGRRHLVGPDPNPLRGDLRLGQAVTSGWLASPGHVRSSTVRRISVASVWLGTLGLTPTQRHR